MNCDCMQAMQKPGKTTTSFFAVLLTRSTEEIKICWLIPMQESNSG